MLGSSRFLLWAPRQPGSVINESGSLRWQIRIPAKVQLATVHLDLFSSLIQPPERPVWISDSVHQPRDLDKAVLPQQRPGPFSSIPYLSPPPSIANAVTIKNTHQYFCRKLFSCTSSAGTSFPSTPIEGGWRVFSFGVGPGRGAMSSTCTFA